MFTIDDLISKMDNHYNRIIIQNDGNHDPDYEPFVGTVDEFRGSDLYNQIADADVTDVYSENDGTIWICYYHEENDVVSVMYITDFDR